jgi:hypothetical protein
MKDDKHMINYELFRMRKLFNPLTLFYRNENLTYKQFKSYLNGLNVMSPGEDYYERVKKRFEQDNKNTVVINIESKEHQTNTISASPAVIEALPSQEKQIDLEKDVTPQLETSAPVKIKTKKRRKAKKNED